MADTRHNPALLLICYSQIAPFGRVVPLSQKTCVFMGTLIVLCVSTNLNICRCGEMADAQDLKSWVRNRTCRFDPDHRHQNPTPKKSREKVYPLSAKKEQTSLGLQLRVYEQFSKNKQKNF